MKSFLARLLKMTPTEENNREKMFYQNIYQPYISSIKDSDLESNTYWLSLHLIVTS